MQEPGSRFGQRYSVLLLLSDWAGYGRHAVQYRTDGRWLVAILARRRPMRTHPAVMALRCPATKVTTTTGEGILRATNKEAQMGLASHVSVLISQDCVRAARFARAPSRAISSDMSCTPPRSKSEIMCGLGVWVLCM